MVRRRSFLTLTLGIEKYLKYFFFWILTLFFLSWRKNYKIYTFNKRGFLKKKKRYQQLVEINLIQISWGVRYTYLKKKIKYFWIIQCGVSPLYWTLFLSLSKFNVLSYFTKLGSLRPLYITYVNFPNHLGRYFRFKFNRWVKFTNSLVRTYYTPGSGLNSTDLLLQDPTLKYLFKLDGSVVNRSNFSSVYAAVLNLLLLELNQFYKLITQLYINFTTTSLI